MVKILLFHLPPHTSAMLLDQCSDGDWVNTRFDCGKIYCFIWQRILTGFSVQMESAPLLTGLICFIGIWG